MKSYLVYFGDNLEELTLEAGGLVGLPDIVSQSIRLFAVRLEDKTFMPRLRKLVVILDGGNRSGLNETCGRHPFWDEFGAIGKVSVARGFKVEWRGEDGELLVSLTPLRLSSDSALRVFSFFFGSQDLISTGIRCMFTPLDLQKL